MCELTHARGILISLYGSEFFFREEQFSLSYGLLLML